jgi:putative DNA primase/helicase
MPAPLDLKKRLGAEPLPPPAHLTEDFLALSFARIHADKLKYCHHRGSWYQWDGTRWKREETRLAFDWARTLCRQMNVEGKTSIAKSATASSVEKFAQADRRFAVTSEIWDRDIWLIGTPGGTVDLRTGKISAARQEDCITRQTLVTPAENPDCPLWLRFLRDATQHDVGLQRFLWQMCGLSLTGSIREHALFFIYGGGGNGKSVFLNALVDIMGDYARTAPMETFTASKMDRHPTDLAMLQGARLVTASETEEGRAWAESRIKQITGGDRVAARFMRQDFFEFSPQFKLVIIGNHKPVLRSVDDAARRRFNIIPFIHKPENPDRQLEDRLRAEYPSIFRWMIEGCLDWRKHGLVRPEAVEKATDVYFEEQDLFGQWLQERCESGLFEVTELLFKSWSDFAAANGEFAGTSRRFGDQLTKHGFEIDTRWVSGKVRKVRLGISLSKIKKERDRCGEGDQ